MKQRGRESNNDRTAAGNAPISDRQAVKKTVLMRQFLTRQGATPQVMIILIARTLLSALSLQNIEIVCLHHAS